MLEPINMKTIICSARFIALMCSLLLPACATAQIQSNQTYNTTTVLGTWSWNVESNRLCSLESGDFWWGWATEKASHLVPLNGAKAALLTGQDFERIDAKYLERVGLSEEKLTGEALKPGAIVVFRTGKGEAGKFQVVGYKGSHDFDFPEAAYLTERWKQFTLSKPEIPAYHLKVKWTLLH